MIRYVPLILLGVLFNALAQVCLKKGMLSIGHFRFAPAVIPQVAKSVAGNPFILLGLLCYVVSVVVWLLVLSRVEMSYAYPFLSVGYIIVTVLGYVLFQESVTFYRILGVIIICLGVILVSRT